ncbi:MAG: hypothetical protein FE78DRAFT_125659, partial [Acidomyces sp. 'richmondensis']
YVDLLNESIVQARGQNRVASEALGPSQIGASYWTSKEKELLFRTLAVHGIGDLQALSQSIGTKSKAEIHVYLSLLQNGVEEVTATFPNPRQFSPVEIPSAFEISAECEEALQLQADELTEKLAKQDAPIYRTAFDEFHSLAVSLTRRLIQATLFQTMTRLRSGDTARTDWKPQPEVTRVDVTTALDILGI